MQKFILHIVLTAVALLVVGNLVSGIDINGIGYALVAAVILGVVNAFVRPVMVVLTLPLTIVTLGLFLLVVNALMLWLASALVPGFYVSGFFPALLGSLLLTILNLLIARLVPRE